MRKVILVILLTAGVLLRKMIGSMADWKILSNLTLSWYT